MNKFDKIAYCQFANRRIPNMNQIMSSEGFSHF